MILEPPADPVAVTNSPVTRSSAMEEDIDDWGRFPGKMKFAGEGAKPNEFDDPGPIECEPTSN